MTQELSEVSGTTEYRYNEHGELTKGTDARGMTMSRTVDAHDRMTFIDYLDDALDTSLTFDDPLVAFSKGRLTAINRNGGTVPYRYDRFGRVLQDGALTYGYHGNGNRVEIRYPGGVTASYTFDFPDREERLVLSEPGQSTKTLATSAAYLAVGPLTSLCPIEYPILRKVFLCSKGAPPSAPDEHPFPGGWLLRHSPRKRPGYRIEVDVPSRTFLLDNSGLDRVRAGGECCCEN